MMRLSWVLLLFQIGLIYRMLEALSIPQATVNQLTKNPHRSLDRRLFEAKALETSKDAEQIRPLTKPPSFQSSSGSKYSQPGTSGELSRDSSGSHINEGLLKDHDFYVYDSPGMILGERRGGTEELTPPSTPRRFQRFTGETVTDRWGQPRLKSFHSGIKLEELPKEISEIKLEDKPRITWKRCFPEVHDDCLWSGGLIKMLRALGKLRRWLRQRLGRSKLPIDDELIIPVHDEPRVSIEDKNKVKVDEKLKGSIDDDYPKITWIYPNRKLSPEKSLPPDDPLESLHSESKHT